MLLAVPLGHRHAGGGRFPLRELKGEPLVLVSHGETAGSLASTGADACRRFRFAPRGLLTTSDFMLALNLVASGVGGTFVPAYMSSIHPESIRYLPVETPLAIEMRLVFATHSAQASASVGDLRELGRVHNTREFGRPGDQRSHCRDVFLLSSLRSSRSFKRCRCAAR